MTHQQLQLGEDLRDQGIRRADQSQPEQWKTTVDEQISRLAKTGRNFTADDIRPLTGDSPTGSTGAMGARFIAASRRGEIRNVGYIRSTKASAHARPLAVWRGAA